MEESQELPECPVCLQPYDGECTIPRVLACGHTVCESCLVNLPKKLPGAIRCPACTVLVKYPPEGPTTLPKNIDLLRLIPASENPRKPVNKPKNVSHVPFLPRSWSDEFYSNWKNYLLRDDDVDRNKVSLLPVGYFSTGGEDDSVFNTEYLVRVMDCLREMKEDGREELGLVLRAFTKQICRICRMLGLWGDLGDGVLYLVSEKQRWGNFLDENLCSFEKDGVFNFAMIGMEMCEAVVSLHGEGLIAGCLSFACFQFDDFGHIYIDLNEVLLTGRGINVMNVVYSGKKISDEEIGILFKDLLKRDVFVSPEVLLKLLDKKGIEVECDSSRYSIGSSSDAWLLSCILLRIVNGEAFSDELVDYMCHIIVKGSENCEIDCSSVYTSFMEKVSSLFGTKFGDKCVPLQQILCKCLDLDPEHRSLVRDVWKCIRELVIKPQFDKLVKLDGASYDENGDRCLVAGKLCLMSGVRPVKQEKEETQGNETNGATDMVNGLTEGSIKSKDLQGHLDCVSGLAVGGAISSLSLIYAVSNSGHLTATLIML
ncbi:Preprotein translocase SecA family protein [Hibiscus syriacus]|uniref:Preprotein translocase SecA family protein n=1 Tax=Hibiscus syriacus TaxID=106335 RepID=A0A6A3BCP3_HIBSY|nr:Preprotein translocase SecA family protein [Hibiscus syriacus]